MRSAIGATLWLGAAVVSSDTADLPLPADLASYRSWKSPTDGPVAVDAEVSELCVGAPHRSIRPPGDMAQRSPHASASIRVRANEAALPRLLRATAPVPVGAVIAKEKLASSDASPAAVAFMLKRDEPRFRATGGWEFRFYPPSGDAEATHQACAACHRSAKAGDYVFAHLWRR